MNERDLDRIRHNGSPAEQMLAEILVQSHDLAANAVRKSDLRPVEKKVDVLSDGMGRIETRVGHISSGQKEMKATVIRHDQELSEHRGRDRVVAWVVGAAITVSLALLGLVAAGCSPL